MTLLLIIFTIGFTLTCFFKRPRQIFTCWFSKYLWDIHNEENAVSKIPDHYKKYRCKNCNKTYKL